MHMLLYIMKSAAVLAFGVAFTTFLLTETESVMRQILAALPQ